MSDQSSNLGLPYLLPAQAQKHVTVNESLLRLDALVQLSVASASTTAQPTSPTDGSVHILPAGKTGAAWNAMANGALAYYRDGTWEQITPREGWLAWVKDTNQIQVFDGAAWSQSALTSAFGFGTAAAKNVGTSGDAVPVLNAATNTTNGLLISTRTSDEHYRLARDGALIGWYNEAQTARRGFFRHDGTNFAFVNETSGGAINFLTTGGGGAFINSSPIFNGGATPVPSTDNTFNIGTPSLRFSTVFATTGTINTSDAREKTALAPIPEGVKRAVRQVISQVGVFQWLEAIERKGEAGARRHVGVTAQSVRDAFLAEGEDPGRWGLFCADPLLAPAAGDGPSSMEMRPVLDDSGAPIVRLGVRPDQLLWLALAGMQPET
jgi:hypothetical protein